MPSDQIRTLDSGGTNLASHDRYCSGNEKALAVALDLIRAVGLLTSRQAPGASATFFVSLSAGQAHACNTRHPRE
jgi:hypothetical protein